MADASAIKEHMEVIGADGVHVGTVYHVDGDRIKLTKNDSSVEIEGARTFGLTSDLTPPIPYYPGIEALWLKAGPLEEALEPLKLEHPLIEGAEAHYTYSSGDALTIRPGDGTAIRVRELRVRPRAPKAELVVGSFWFDDTTGQLVRAAYRPAAALDVWMAMRQSPDSATRA